MEICRFCVLDWRNQGPVQMLVFWQIWKLGPTVMTVFVYMYIKHIQFQTAWNPSEFYIYPCAIINALNSTQQNSNIEIRIELSRGAYWRHKLIVKTNWFRSDFLELIWTFVTTYM